jgi:transcriptional regulator with XRE-family HTH domain
LTGPDLLAWRARVGWSQKRLADALRVPVNTVARWERGEMRVQHPTILRLALWALERKAKPHPRALPQR